MPKVLGLGGSREHKALNAPLAGQNDPYREKCTDQKFPLAIRFEISRLAFAGSPVL